MDRVTRGMQLIREVEQALRLSLSVMEEKDGRHGNELGQSPRRSNVRSGVEPDRRFGGSRWPVGFRLGVFGEQIVQRGLGRPLGFRQLLREDVRSRIVGRL